MIVLWRLGMQKRYTGCYGRELGGIPFIGLLDVFYDGRNYVGGRCFSSYVRGMYLEMEKGLQ